MSPLVPADQIQSRILVIRGVRVLLDSDIAQLFGVSTKRLNEQVKRNPDRFPHDFCFRITMEEVAHLKSQIATSRYSHGGRRSAPSAFTEHGVLMVANVVNSPRAIQMSVHVARAFLQLRQTFVTHRALASKLDELDARVGEHDDQLSSLIDTIRLLTTPDAPSHGRKIGFNQ